MTDIEQAKIRLQEISVKNKATNEYSLGDVLLLDKFEKVLKENGYTRRGIEELSISYYGVQQIYLLNN